MKIDTAKKGIIKNTLYTIGGALVLNAVLQLFIYPRLTSEMGAKEIGNVIYIMGLINIIGPSVGQALNTSRLVLRRDHELKNGDYNVILIILSVIGAGVCAAMSADAMGGVLGGILLVICSVLTTLRFYGDVEYRISLDYKRYFIYYLSASVGYILGYLIYKISNVWYPVFIAGELCAIIYVSVKGKIFRNFFERSSFAGTAAFKGMTLVGSYLLTNITLNVDKIALKHLIGSEAVTQYYVASLIGKTLVLLIAPINTIIISYLTKGKERIGYGKFLKFTGAGFLVSFVFFLACQVANPIFIRLFYGDILSEVKDILTVVNISQILSLLSAYLFIVVLTFTEEKWQLILQGAHMVILVILILAMTGKGGIAGFSEAVLIANAVRIAAVLILGMMRAGRRKAVEV